jgi:hypothetical protein
MVARERVLVCDRILLDEVGGRVQLQFVQQLDPERVCASPLMLIGRARVEHQASPRPEASDYFRSSEAVQARHIDIEQHGVGVVLRHKPYSLDPVACFANDGHVRKEAEQPA